MGTVISDSHHKYAGFYSDYTSSRYTVRDTVLFNVPNAFEYYNSAEGKTVKTDAFDPKNAIKYINTWSDTMNIKETAAGPAAYVEMEPIKFFTNHDMPDEVTRIVAEAGLEDEWHYIYDRAPELEYWAKRGPDVANSSANFGTYNEVTSARGKFYTQTANTLVEKGKFGNLPWHFDIDKYFALKAQAERYDGGGGKVGRTATHLMDEHYMAVLVTETYDTSVHPELDEMFAMCEELLNNTSEGKELGSAPKAAIDKFNGAIDKVKTEPSSTSVEKAIAAKHLEEAYEEFYNSKFKADIIWCHIPDGETTVDAENKTVTVNVPANTDFSAIVPEFVTTDDAIIAVDLSKLDYTKSENNISVCNKEIGKYSTWKLIVNKAIKDSADNISVDSEKWNKINPNASMASNDGRIHLQPWWDPYMMNESNKGKLSFTTNVLSGDPEKGVHYIFSAQTSNLEYDGDNTKNTFYEMVLKGTTAYLNRVDAGVVTEMAKIENVYFGYGEDNKITINVDGRTNIDIIKISLNGKTIFNHLVRNPIGAEGFFGVYSVNQKVEIAQ